MITTVTFERRTGNADNGKIVISTTNNGLTEPLGVDEAVKLQMRVIAPTGVIYDSITPNEFDETNLTVGSEFVKKLTIPTLSGADVAGQYTVTLKVFLVPDEDQTQEITCSVEYCPCNKASVKFKSYCEGPSVQVFDTTPYTGWTVLDRTLKLVHPVIDDNQLSDVITSGSQISVVPTHSNVTYIGYVTANVQKEESVADNDVPFNTMTFYQNMTWTGSKNHLFLCSTSLKAIAKCFEDKMRELSRKACRVGGYRLLTKEQYDLMMELQTNWTLYHMARECGDYDRMTTYHDVLKEILNCGCCGGNEATVLEPIEFDIQPVSTDTNWADIPEDMLFGDWVKVAPLQPAIEFLQWKINQNIVYIRGVIVNESIAAGVSAIPQKVLNLEFLSSRGINLAPYWTQMIEQEPTAGSQCHMVGRLMVWGNYLQLQRNENYDQFPIRLSLTIPLV